jgi:hypothetical protein
MSIFINTVWRIAIGVMVAAPIFGRLFYILS